jgi:hypothetical protein
MNYCSYFQAEVKKAETWFFVATLRSFEHYAFDRTLDKERGLFEFFVPQGYEKKFVQLMSYYQDKGIISGFNKLENRLKGGAKF